MKKIRNVKLEILRNGPPHNQLLSPLTNYLALSGRHEAVSLQIPYEHWSFLTMLRALRYQESDESTLRSQVKEVAGAVCGVFSKVPGMISDISNGGTQREELVQLRLVFSASELALLPFELANAPAGFPGEGLSLSLQLDTPIVVTREIRGADGFEVSWSRKPRILFAASAPSGVGSVPWEAHLAALRQALDPWIGPKLPGESPSSRLDEWLTFLPDASLDKIQKACATGDYTHIHILAHGADTSFGKEKKDPFNQDLRFGLALHPSQGSGVDVVEGERLAQAIRSHRRDLGANATFSQPVVVTVASCDSGQQGSVVMPGSSLAHSLHESGIPLVVASLFPLTKRGSVCMVQTLYSRLLWGEDPRVCLHELRQNLRGQDQVTHDWASVVAYTSLPDDLESQLKQMRTMQAQRGMRTALARERFYTDHAEGEDACDTETLEKSIQALETALEKMPDISEFVDDCILKSQEQRIQLLGTVASAEKRRAVGCWKLAECFNAVAKAEGRSVEEKAKSGLQERKARNKAMEALEFARRFYQRAFMVNQRSHWAATQWLSLDIFVKWTRTQKIELDHEIWTKARACAAKDTRQENEGERAYAYANLLELDYLALGADLKNPTVKMEDLVEHARNFLSLVRPRTLEVETTLWQFERYRTFLAPTTKMKKAAKDICKVLKTGLEPQKVHLDTDEES